MRREMFHTISGLFAVTLLLLPRVASAGPPTQQVRSTVEEIHTIMLESRPQLPDEKRKPQVAKIKRLLARRFDFGEMARRALGPEWQKRSSRERGEYVKVFTDILEASYLDRLEKYAGEQMVYLRENRDGDYAEVASKALAVKGEDLPINYRLKHAGSGNWKVYDLVIDNVSIVNNYRAQFSRLLNSGSFDKLIAQLRESREHQLQAKRSRPDPTLISAWLLAQATSNRPR